MEKKDFKINEQLVFPEENSFIIGKILEKYGLAEIQKEKIKEILTSPPPEGNVFEALEDLPGAKMVKLVKNLAESRISRDAFLSQLEKLLNISKKEVEEVAKELEEKIIIYAKPIIEEKKVPQIETPPPETKPQTTKPIVTTEEPKIPTEEPKTPTKKDVYREPVE